MAKTNGAGNDPPANDNLIVKAAVKVLARKYPDRTFERLLCDPRAAMQFCIFVRSEMGLDVAATLADETILWRTLNSRKKGGFNHGKKRKARR